MGTSHCEQMLRNNEDEWKAVNQRAKERGEKGLGDFNYVTNRATMQKYWEDRVKTNGKYENTYTLGFAASTIIQWKAQTPPKSASR